MKKWKFLLGDVFTKRLLLVLLCCFIYLMLSYLLTPDLRVASTLPESKEQSHPEIDIMGSSTFLAASFEVCLSGTAVKPTCVTARSIAALNEYFSPRRIIVVTTSEKSCQKFRSFAPNVECLLETGLLPDVSKATIEAFLKQHYGKEGGGFFYGREDAGWYFQQFLKMGAQLYIKNLSQHFIVWDLDMILLKPLSIYHESEFGQQTIMNIGGLNPGGYYYAYKNLTGTEMKKAPDGTSFVTHWMIVYQPFMQEYLGFLSTCPKPSDAPGGSPWVWAILSALDPNELHIGFSEYASYASWVLQHHPQSVYVMPNKTWSRHPIGGPNALALSKAFNKNRLCCPTDAIVSSMRALGYQYSGFEIGHHPACHYNNAKYKYGYGV